MVEFESRQRKFISIGDIGILNERVFGLFRVKHLLYFFPAIILLWGGLRGVPAPLALGCAAGITGILSSLFSRGSMSFEAKSLSLLLSLFCALVRPRRRSENE
ncbi:MAG: hypothetical protein QXK88_01390 [Desulfurococcaceae archaeon]